MEKPTSWAPQVTADNSLKWGGNRLRFATRDEALAYARDLARRWTLVKTWRAAPSSDAVNAIWDARTGRLLHLNL
jgi:hypothetical protein